MIPSTFYTKAEYRIKHGHPLSTVYELADTMNIPHDEVQEWIDNIPKDRARKNAVSEGREAIYNALDETIINEHPHLVIVRRGDNSEFYEYSKGVYVYLSKQDIRNIVDARMFELDLSSHRSNRKKVLDTVERIASTLARVGRVYTEERIQQQPWRINMQNGLLDPTTGTLYPHTPEYFSISQVPHVYDTTVTCPKFIEFVNTISNGDETFTKMLQQMFGYCLMDGNPKHKVFYLYGSTARNGKSTAAKILMGLIGRSNCTTLSLSQVSNENNRVLQSLVGKQINFSDEVSSKYIESSLLTTLSAEGVVHIDPKYKDSYDYQVRAKFIVACNDIPRFESGQGMSHRMHIIPFDYHIPADKRIERYDELLLKEEGSGILNWAIEGLRELQEGKTFVVSDRAKEDTNDARLESNPVQAYIEETYTLDSSYTDVIGTDEMYGHPRVSGKEGQVPTGYFAYCEAAGIRPMSRMKFSKEVSRYADMSKKIQRDRSRDVVGINSKRGYVGLKKTDDIF